VPLPSKGTESTSLRSWAMQRGERKKDTGTPNHESTMRAKRSVARASALRSHLQLQGEVPATPLSLPPSLSLSLSVHRSYFPGWWSCSGNDAPIHSMPRAGRTKGKELSRAPRPSPCVVSVCVIAHHTGGTRTYGHSSGPHGVVGGPAFS